MPVQNDLVLCQPDLEENNGERKKCGPPVWGHRASDTQIRIARLILEYNVTCRLEFFHTFVGVRCLYIYLLPFPSR